MSRTTRTAMILMKQFIPGHRNYVMTRTIIAMVKLMKAPRLSFTTATPMATDMEMPVFQQTPAQNRRGMLPIILIAVIMMKQFIPVPRNYVMARTIIAMIKPMKALPIPPITATPMATDMEMQALQPTSAPSQKGMLPIILIAMIAMKQFIPVPRNYVMARTIIAMDKPMKALPMPRT